MDRPCNHCDKADDRKETVLKCDKPCRQGKNWYECEKKIIEIFQGKLKIRWRKRICVNFVKN